MKERHMIEPEGLPQHRMPHNGRSNSARPQTVAIEPLCFQPIPAAMRFNFRFIAGLKYRFPGKTERGAEIPDVHATLLLKLLHHLFWQPGKDFSTIGNRRLSTAGRRQNATEKYFHRPAALVRVFVMKKNALIGGVVGRRVNLAFYEAAGR